MVCCREVVRNRHNLTYIYRALKREENAVVCHEFCLRTTVKDPGVLEVSTHFNCRYAFHLYGICHFTEQVSNHQDYFDLSFTFDELVKYVDTDWLQSFLGWDELESCGFLLRFHSVPLTIWTIAYRGVAVNCWGCPGEILVDSMIGPPWCIALSELRFMWRLRSFKECGATIWTPFSPFLIRIPFSSSLNAKALR